MAGGDTRAYAACRCGWVATWPKTQAAAADAYRAHLRSAGTLARLLPADADVAYGEPMYDGLFVWPLVGEDGKTRHIVSRMRSVREGAMREFVDPVSGETVGCCGRNFAEENVKLVADFVAERRRT